MELCAIVPGTDTSAPPTAGLDTLWIASDSAVLFHGKIDQVEVMVVWKVECAIVPWCWTVGEEVVGSTVMRILMVMARVGE